MLRAAPRRIAVLCSLALVVPATAAAQAPAPVVLDGSPLNVYTSADGSVQASVDGFTVSEFYPPNGSDPAGNPAPSQSSNAGFALIPFSRDGSTSQYYSAFEGSPLPNPEGPTLTPGNPSTISTSWTVPSPDGGSLRVTQVLSYANGSRQFDAVYTVANVGEIPVPFRAGVGGDLAIRGSDSGVGFLDAGPPRFVGGVNPNVGAAGGFVEQTPWSHFQVDQYSTVSSNLSGTGLNDQIQLQEVDNGAAVSWDQFQSPNSPLQPGQSAEFRVGYRFVDTLGLDPPSGTEQTGDEHVVKVTLAGINGAPGANQPLRWEVTGANPASGSVKTSSEGKAKIGWIGGNPGQDVLTVFTDANGNKIRDLGETQATANVTWEGPAGPIIGQTVNVREVKGKVRVKLPKGTSLGRAKALGIAPAATHKFVPLSQAETIPVGSILDTTKGTARLLSAGLAQRNNSAFNGGSFHGAQFSIGQRGNRPLTTLSMKGGGLKRCKTRVPKGGAKKIAFEARRRHRRSRRLFGSGRGRFRTRGRNSSATVRGTKWLQKDTCSGTLTRVTRGVVVVRDFTKHKTVRVKAGKKYFARAPKKRRH